MTDQRADRTISNVPDGMQPVVLARLVEERLKASPDAPVSAVFVARDGRRVLCSGSANLLMRDGRPVATQAIFRDVTEQRRAERDLASSRANLAALVENTGDTIWSVDRQERLITFNSAFALAVEARTGREPKVGMVPGEMFLPPDVPFYDDSWVVGWRVGTGFLWDINDRVGWQVTIDLKYSGELSDQAGIGMVGFERINSVGNRWTIPIMAGAYFKF